MEANVILSQGGQAVKVGASYFIVSLGKELKDPQTGESLGRTETACCDVLIDRVSSNLAYGHLENVKISLDSVDPVGLQVREELKPQAIASVPVTFTAPSSQSPSATSAATLRKAQAVQIQPPDLSAPSVGNSRVDDSKKW